MDITNLMKKSYPKEPGVYIMKDNTGKIIYIGKAKNLEKRIKSYFNKSKFEDKKENWKTHILVSKIKEIEFVVTDNEVEALLLESNLIKKHRPFFNIDLKDQQRHTYLKITNEKFPRLIVTRRNRKGNFTGIEGEVFGPFVKGSSKFLTAGFLRKMYKIRICNRLPKKECLEYHIGNCDAPCINKISQEEYHKNILQVKDILKVESNLKEFYKRLEEEMNNASKKMDYERAISIRDTLSRLNNLLEHQKIENVSSLRNREEFIGITFDDEKKSMYIMSMISKNGVINDMKKYRFQAFGDNPIEEFISQYYYGNSNIPDYIYINTEIKDKRNLEKFLEKISNHSVEISTIYPKDINQINQPRNNENDEYIPNVKSKIEGVVSNRPEIMKLVLNNLNKYKNQDNEPGLNELKNLLMLKKIPLIIDCFDISNTGKDFAVGACTRFIDAVPFKQGYRKFRIKRVSGQDDFSMMQEIVKRHFMRKIEIRKNNDTIPINNEDKIPNLVVIDGGRGHLNVALKILRELQLDVECISIAKENEEIFTEWSNLPINIARDQKALKILQHIRDEAHRFGLSYNRSLRKIK